MERFLATFVTGHIDEVGIINSIEKKDLCEVWGVEVSNKLMKFFPEKGSVAINRNKPDCK